MSTDFIKLERKEDYPFYNENAEEGKMVITAILDLSEEERIKFCDKSQLRDSKYRTPKIGAEHIKQKIKEREQTLESFPIIVEHAREQEKKVKEQESIISSLTEQLTEQQEKHSLFVAQTEERFNKLAQLVLSLSEAK